MNGDFNYSQFGTQQGLADWLAPGVELSGGNITEDLVKALTALPKDILSMVFGQGFFEPFLNLQREDVISKLPTSKAYGTGPSGKQKIFGGGEQAYMKDILKMFGSEMLPIFQTIASQEGQASDFFTKAMLDNRRKAEVLHQV